MLTRRIKLDSDYEQLAAWWKGWDWAPVPKTSLPKTGAIVDNLAAGFLYKTDSDLAWLEFIISNPEAEKQVRREATEAVMDRLILEAQFSGAKHIFTSAHHPRFIETCKSKGFKVTDTTMTNMVKGLI